MKLYIRPGPADIRERLLKLAVQEKLVKAGTKLGARWKTRTSSTILKAGDYQEMSPEEMAARVRDFWNRFVTHDLPRISDHLSAEKVSMVLGK